MDNTYISAHEYEKNVNPQLTSILFYERNVKECNYGIDIVDFSYVFNVSYKINYPKFIGIFHKIRKKW